MIRLKNKNRLILSFLLIISLFVFSGIITINGLLKLGNLTRMIYNHPLVVSNASLSAALNITKMHRSMKDFVTAYSPIEEASVLESVSESEKLVYQDLDLIRKNILGREGQLLEEQARSFFSKWKVIRDKVVMLSNSGNKEEAVLITKVEGAAYVKDLDALMMRLTSYARNKANRFLALASTSQSHLENITIYIIIAGVILSILIAFTAIYFILKSETALKESQLSLKTLINTIPDMIWLKDQEGVYITCNPRFEDFFGATEEEIVGKTDYDFVDKELADFFRKNDQISIDSSGPTMNEEKVTMARSGEKVMLETIKTPVSDLSGKVIGVLGVARDITRRKEAELELEKHRLNLEELITERTSDLKEKNEYLQRLNDAMVDRELRFEQLQKEISELKSQLDKK